RRERRVVVIRCSIDQVSRTEPERQIGMSLQFETYIDQPRGAPLVRDVCYWLEVQRSASDTYKRRKLPHVYMWMKQGSGAELVNVVCNGRQPGCVEAFVEPCVLVVQLHAGPADRIIAQAE